MSSMSTPDNERRARPVRDPAHASVATNRDNWFGEWLSRPVRCRGIRLVIDEMSEMVVSENWNPETGAVTGSPGLTWGGLWIPAVIYRHFWPDGEHHALVRPGGYLRFRQEGRWDVTVDDGRAEVNGLTFRMDQRTTYRLDCRTGQAEPLPLNSDIP